MNVPREQPFDTDFNAFDALYTPHVIEGMAEYPAIEGGCENCSNDQAALDTVDLIVRILNADPVHYDRAIELLRLTLFNAKPKATGAGEPASGHVLDVSDYWDDVDDELPSVEFTLDLDDDIPLQVTGAGSHKNQAVFVSSPETKWEEVTFEAGSAPEHYPDAADDDGPALVSFNDETYVPETYSSAALLANLQDLLLGV